MIKKGMQQILKHQLINIVAAKYEYNNIILKSIIHNQNIPYKTKLYAHLMLKKTNLKKTKKICMITGKHKSVNNFLNISRHNVNYFSKLGLLQNFKIKSW